MIEIGRFKCANLNELLEIYEEYELKDIFSSFVCSKNSEIELFLKNNAIEFYKKVKIGFPGLVKVQIR